MPRITFEPALQHQGIYDPEVNKYGLYDAELVAGAGVTAITGAAALLVAQPGITASGTSVDNFTGTAALSVAQPSIAASGTVLTPITGTAALTVPQPVVAASGTVTATITGTAALTVPQPVVAASGTSVNNFTGTAALTVPAPRIDATGTIPVTTPPAVGGRPRRRAVVSRYPERKYRHPVDAHPLYGQLVPVFEGDASARVKPPRIRARGLVTTLAELDEDRAVLSLVNDDEDLALALTLADTWLT